MIGVWLLGVSIFVSIFECVNAEYFMKKHNAKKPRKH